DTRAPRHRRDESARGGDPVSPSARGSGTRGRFAKSSETSGSERAAGKRSNTTDPLREHRVGLGPARAPPFFLTRAAAPQTTITVQQPTGTLLPAATRLSIGLRMRFRIPGPSALPGTTPERTIVL